MRKIVFISLLLLTGLLTACSTSGDPGITPAADRPTFLFFFTDG